MAYGMSDEMSALIGLTDSTYDAPVSWTTGSTVVQQGQSTPSTPSVSNDWTTWLRGLTTTVVGYEIAKDAAKNGVKPKTSNYGGTGSAVNPYLPANVRKPNLMPWIIGGALLYALTRN